MRRECRGGAPGLTGVLAGVVGGKAPGACRGVGGGGIRGWPGEALRDDFGW